MEHIIWTDFFELHAKYSAVHGLQKGSVIAA